MTATSDTSWVPDPPTDADLTCWGLDPAWSRMLDVPSHAGGTRRWHVLDTGPVPDAPASATVLCVHGNPTWGYAWASFLRELSDRHRVIAIDQLGMGFSERAGRRRYVDRVRDLDDVIVALGLPGGHPLVLAAHDWGGAIAMGWVVQDPRQVAGLILCNTGIAVPDGRSAPAIIRVAASAPLLDLLCRGTRIFVEGTIWLSRKRLSTAERDAFRAPYRSAPARAGIADFVDDIPLSSGHPSELALADVADRLHKVGAPVLLAWGSKDPVFNDDFAADLAGRFPNTTLQRFPKASHLVMAEADVAPIARQWLADLAGGRLAPVAAVDSSPERPPLWAELDARRTDDTTAFVDLATGDELTFAELVVRVEAVAAELGRRGLVRGDRVAMLTPPGIDLVAAVYGVWRAGGVAVVADRGLGLRGLGIAVRGSRPKWVVGPKKALAAAASMRWAARAERIDVADLVGAASGDLPPPPGPDDDAAVLFTSGATGPAKGVRYLHRQLAAQRDALAATYEITGDDRLVAAFAPFALYGPALGIPTALPACDVTTPGELTAQQLDDACRRIGATLAFASPAALANVVDTAQPEAGTDRDGGTAALRTVLSAGAPVPSETLRGMSERAPNARLHTPYGMTEALPVADIDLERITAAESEGSFGGVCVGHPVDGAEVRIAPLSFDADTLPDEIPAGETGEILVSAPWVSAGYLGLWGTQRTARPPAPFMSAADGSSAHASRGPAVWHRTGDVGHVDTGGRLWVEGRSVHVISTSDGPITPVPIERRIESELELRRVAAAGVGPPGSQQLVVVVEAPDGAPGFADDDTSAAVRSQLDVPVAAVLVLRRLPVDIRHNAKIDRAAVASWASDVLAGRRSSPPA